MKKAIRYSLLAMATVSALTACQKNDLEENPGINAWAATATTERTVDGKSIPSQVVLDCRIRNEVRNLHYYYQVIGNMTAGERSVDDKGNRVLKIPQGQLSISRYSINAFDSHGSSSSLAVLMLVDADLQLVETPAGVQQLIAKLPAADEDFIRQNYPRDPYFAALKAGDDLVRFTIAGGKVIHSTAMFRPGLTYDDPMECQTRPPTLQGTQLAK